MPLQNWQYIFSLKIIMPLHNWQCYFPLKIIMPLPTGNDTCKYHQIAFTTETTDKDVYREPKLGQKGISVFSPMHVKGSQVLYGLRVTR